MLSALCYLSFLLFLALCMFHVQTVVTSDGSFQFAFATHFSCLICCLFRLLAAFCSLRLDCSLWPSIGHVGAVTLVVDSTLGFLFALASPPPVLWPSIGHVGGWGKQDSTLGFLFPSAFTLPPYGPRSGTSGVGVRSTYISSKRNPPP